MLLNPLAFVQFYVNFCAMKIFRSGGNRRGRQKDYVPTMWNEHFEEKEDVILDKDQIFRVYFSKRDKQNQKPLLVLLHGGEEFYFNFIHFYFIFNFILFNDSLGGYSALTWAHFTVNKTLVLICR